MVMPRRSPVQGRIAIATLTAENLKTERQPVPSWEKTVNSVLL